MPFCSCILSKFYIKPQRNFPRRRYGRRCILSKFYIKPQPQRPVVRGLHRCILSKFYIKPQPRANHIMKRMVVSYRNSTSNHNLLFLSDVTNIVVSYRNSTSNHNFCVSHASRYTVVSYRNSTSNHNNGLINGFLGQLYLIEILHQTTTPGWLKASPNCCILSKFYIKPQRQFRRFGHLFVVSYRNSTSNHNSKLFNIKIPFVVSYRNSTSNHNGRPRSCPLRPVVSYRNSTSNHNWSHAVSVRSALYLIEILHQTTTVLGIVLRKNCCILSKFYIKPQLSVHYQ